MLSISVIVLAAVLLIMPLYIVYSYNTRFMGSLLRAVLMMSLRMIVLALVVFMILLHQSLLLSMLFVLVCLLYNAVAIVYKVRSSFLRVFIPVAAGLAVSAVVTCGQLLLCAYASGVELTTCLCLSLVAIVTGNMTKPVSGALSEYFSGLRKRNSLFLFLTCNGCTKGEAVSYIERRAMQKALIPGLSDMAGMAMTTTPLVFWMLVVCKETVMTALVAQLIIVLASLSASSVAAFVAVKVAVHSNTINTALETRPNTHDSGSGDALDTSRTVGDAQ